LQPTYFASFLLGEQGGAAPAVSDALEQVGDWIFTNRYRTLARPQDWPNITAPVTFPNGEKLQMLRLSEAGGATLQACALRYEHPDPQGRIWRTDCVISQSIENRAVRFAVTVSAGGATEREYALRPPTIRPRIVRQMMEKFHAHERYALTPKF
jgi:hypothetical protein